MYAMHVFAYYFQLMNLLFICEQPVEVFLEVLLNSRFDIYRCLILDVK